jgi:carbamoyl-phosphate synthase large subunit
MQLGLDLNEIYGLTGIDPWFLHKLADILDDRKVAQTHPLESLTAPQMYRLKQQGFSDRQIAFAKNTTEDYVRDLRQSPRGVSRLQTVDTCAAEFEAYTPYYYSTYEEETEVRAQRSPQSHDSRRRAESHWSGHRV